MKSGRNGHSRTLEEALESERLTLPEHREHPLGEFPVRPADMAPEADRVVGLPSWLGEETKAKEDPDDS